MKDFQQIQWDGQTEAACRAIVRLAVAEDLQQQQDWTTVALVPEGRPGSANVVAREAGVVAGIATVPIVVEEMQGSFSSHPAVSDGDQVAAGDVLATLRGEVRSLLTCERTILNLLSRLMGIATVTRRYVEEVEGTSAGVYDTRKTTPGWRRLEKYAVRCGGGRNHRLGLFDAILIKDNHLAQAPSDSADDVEKASQAVLQAKHFATTEAANGFLVEVEVDTLEQLSAVLPACPDIVLLDNMSVESLRKAVKLRNELAPLVQLEASGGVQIGTLREIATTGVERISVGALTHSARSLDIGLDWHNE